MRATMAVLAAAVLWGQAFAEPVLWPDGRRVAVVLTYDDALTSQLDNAIPALDAAGFKATFFLSGSGLKAADIARWRAAAAAGQELGNHTIFHPCVRGTFPMPDRNNSENYKVADMLGEISAMNTTLTAIDGKLQHSFAMPCGQRLAGDVDYIEALRKSGLARYARGIAPTGDSIDPMAVPSTWFGESATGADLIAAVKRAEQTGGLLVFGFHGVGGDYLKVSAEAHAELVAYLKAHKATIWTASFSTVMDYATAKK